MKLREVLKSSIVSTVGGVIACSTLLIGAPAAAEEKVDASHTVTVDKIRVSGFTFTGNHQFTAEQLNEGIRDVIGQSLGLEELKATAERIAAYYHANGYKLAKVILPKQIFSESAPITIAVFEGQLGNVAITGNQRYLSDNIRDILAANGVRQDEVIRLPLLERSVVQINRQSGVETSAALSPSSEIGKTDLQLKVKEAPRVAGALSINDFGSKNTGRHRLNANLNFADLSGNGDQLTVYAMKALGSGDAWFTYANYSTPINAYGTYFDAYGLKGNVRVGRSLSVLDIVGKSSGFGIGFHQDFVYSASNILTYQMWYEGADTEQNVLADQVIGDNIRKLRVGLSYTHSAIGSRTIASVDIHRGLGANFGGMENDSVLSSRPYARADNEFTKLTFDLSYIRRLDSHFTIIPHLFGQYAFDSLVSGEEFAIGGNNSVMGHESSAYSGDNGITVAFEARYNIFADDPKYQLVSSISHGRIQIKRPFIDQDSSQSLSGVSFGLIANPWKSVQFRVDLAAPLGAKTESDYFYAQASYSF
ncbi:hypothetical protein L9G15_19320 [Shewanella sp. A3A]|nr:hypothetical protein [Shewanella ferrihydritica]